MGQVRTLFLATVIALFCGQVQANGPPSVGIECRKSLMVIGLFAIRKTDFISIEIERNQRTGKLMFAILTYKGYKGVRQLMVNTQDFRPIIECVEGR